MTEKELGKALLNVDPAREPPVPDARQLTERVLKRDRLWIRWLAGLAAFFWFLAAAGIIWITFLYVMLVAPRLRAYGAGRAQLQDDWNDWAIFGDWIAKSIWGFVVPLLLGGVCTVLLILISRRATLRQINASLAEISEQLKQLRQPPPSEPRGTSGTA